MAATITTTKSTAGYVDPGMGVFGGVVTATANLNSGTDQPLSNRHGLQLQIFHVTDMGTGETIATGIPNIVAVAWQPEDCTDDVAGVCLTAQSTGTVTFIATNAANAGWLWVLSGARKN